jgi:superfamily I DNA/RNA helicase
MGHLAAVERLAAMAAQSGIVSRVDRIWMLHPFSRALAARERELVPRKNLADCVDQLFANPQHPGLNLEVVDHVGDLDVLSARISQSYRLILVRLSRTEIGLLYFDNHDEAYRWVDRHRATIPTMLTRIEEVARNAPPNARFEPMPCTRLTDEDPLAVASAEQFGRILEDGVERYLTYLDEEQRYLAEAQASGLLLIKGGAGTGKTAVAIHRVLALARQPRLIEPSRVLYLCYNRMLAQTVRELLAFLSGGSLPPTIEARTFHDLCGDVVKRELGELPTIDENAYRDQVYRAYGRLTAEDRAILAPHNGRFVADEIIRVIKTNGLRERQEYLSFNRRGREIRLREVARSVIWKLYEEAEAAASQRQIRAYEDLPLLAQKIVEDTRLAPPYATIVIDEGQDFSPAMIRLSRRLLAADGQLTVFADPAQAIYDNGWQWTQRELRPTGGNVRWLRNTYRTTREVFDLAQPLLQVDEEPSATVVPPEPPDRRGPLPRLYVGESVRDVCQELARRIAAEAAVRPPGQIGVLAARWETLMSLEKQLADLGVPARLLRDGAAVTDPTVKLTTMHSAKGLDFPVVFVVGPLKSEFGPATQASGSETSRLLYVALTRASVELTIGMTEGQHHPLLERLDPTCYTAEGPRSREFINLRGRYAEANAR